jgi:hypothetical protein
MTIDTIYTMANARVRLQFLAMERSLRAVGCDLPIKVFPYDEQLFDLPKGSEWLRTPLHAWLNEQGAHRMCSKYFCLTRGGSVFTDTDIIFLRDPAKALRPFEGFVVADPDWNKPQYTFTPESAAILGRRSSLWLQRVFNAGHFACDRALYADEDIRALAAAHPETCLHDTDQTGMNLLVGLTDVPFQNLNLPPSRMESTWAGDYPGAFEPLWSGPDRKPYFIHWSGPVLDEERPIHELFYAHLTTAEKAEWSGMQAERMRELHRRGRWPVGVRALNHLLRTLYPKFYVQPRPRR